MVRSEPSRTPTVVMLGAVLWSDYSECRFSKAGSDVTEHRGSQTRAPLGA